MILKEIHTMEYLVMLTLHHHIIVISFENSIGIDDINVIVGIDGCCFGSAVFTAVLTCDSSISTCTCIVPMNKAARGLVLVILLLMLAPWFLTVSVSAEDVVELFLAILHWYDTTQCNYQPLR
jgi:H+/Cl- antiporter ClcA